MKVGKIGLTMRRRLIHLAFTKCTHKSLETTLSQVLNRNVAKNNVIQYFHALLTAYNLPQSTTVIISLGLSFHSSYTSCVCKVTRLALPHISLIHTSRSGHIRDQAVNICTPLHQYGFCDCWGYSHQFTVILCANIIMLRNANIVIILLCPVLQWH